MVQLSYWHVTTGKATALTTRTFIDLVAYFATTSHFQI